MARTLTVQPKAPRRVAQVRAGQTTIEEAPAPASPLEQLSQIDALLNSPTPTAYSAVVRESGWAEIVKSRLVELEEKSRDRRERIAQGTALIEEREAMGQAVPPSWYERVVTLGQEAVEAEERHRHLLWQYERQLGERAS